MANANITHVQLVNTFNEWRAATNDLIEDRNILRNSTYVKDNGSLILLSTVNNSPLLTVGSAGNGNVTISNVLNVTTVNANSLFVNRDAVITGNLTVLGNTTTLNTETLTVEDSDIVVLSNVSGVPSLNAGFTVNRGSSTNTFLRWNEAVDRWGWSDDGTTMYNFVSALDAYGQANNAYAQANTAYNQANSARDQANTAYGQANTARTTANDSYGQANTARDQANTARDQANTARTTANNAYTQANNAYAKANDSISSTFGGTITGDIIITGNLTVSGNQTILNTEVLTTEDAEIVLLSNVAGTPALNAGLIVNRGTSTNTFMRWNEATDKWGWSDNGTTFFTFDTSLNAYAQANAAYTQANNSYASANLAYTQANTARDTANGAYAQANGAYAQANGAYAQANNAANTVAVYANNALVMANANVNYNNTATMNVTVTANSTNRRANIEWNANTTAIGNQITLRSYRDAVVTNTNVGAANTVDLSTSNWFLYTLTGSSGNRQLTFANAPNSGTGFTVTLIIIQDGTGSKTPTWSNTIYWAGGQVPPATTAASARDLWTFTTYDGGSTFLGTLAVKDAK